MHIVIDAQPDPALWRATFRHMLRPAALRLRLMGGLLVVVGALVVLLSSAGFGELWPLGAVVIGMGIAYAFLLPVRVLRASLRRVPPVLQQPQRIELTERSVRMVSPLVSSEYAWAAFVRTQEIPGVLLLMIGKNQVLPVPIGGLPPDELAQLREFLANLAYIRQ